MQLYTFEQAGIIHNTWYNKVYSCVFLYVVYYFFHFYFDSRAIQSF